MEKGGNSMTSSKKRYSKPQLIRHGDVEEITRSGGFDFVDVPMGTPVDGDISNVVS